MAFFILITAGCRDRSPAGDIGTDFTPTDTEQVRELGIYAGEERVGDLRFGRQMGLWQGQIPAVELSETVKLRLSFQTDRFSISSNQRTWANEDLGLLGGDGSLDFGAGSWETRVLRRSDGVYQREQVTSGSRNRDILKVPEGALISNLLPLYLEGLSMQEGARLELDLYNITLDQQIPLTVVYRGRTGEGRQFAMTYWGMEEKVWIDAAGMIAREDMALGVSARVPEGKNRIGYLPLEMILTQTGVPGVNIPPDLGQRGKVEFVLHGSFRTPPEGKWQHVDKTGDETRVILTRPTIPSASNRRPDPARMPDDTFGLDLDSQRIQDLASRIVGSLKDPWEKSLAIGKWVHAEIGKSMRECLSALQVLEVGEGECQSHSLLTVSLCRAAGLPARFAYGVVYLPDRELFGYHTWVQVYVGEWIPLDPTLGNFPAGVDHLTLAVGGYQDQFQLFPYIMGTGGWRIKMEESSPESRVQRGKDSPKAKAQWPKGKGDFRLRIEN